MSFFGVVKGMCGWGGGLKVRTHYYEKSVCRERYERSHVIARGGVCEIYPPLNTSPLKTPPRDAFLNFILKAAIDVETVDPAAPGLGNS